MTSGQPRYCMALDCLRQQEVSLDVMLGNGSAITLSLCKGCVSKFKNAKVRGDGNG